MARPRSTEIVGVIVVADASPLNYLILIDEIDLLPKLFGTVLVPAGVVAELQDPSAPAQARQWIADPPVWLEIKETPEIRREVAYLDRGESEAISLALALNIPSLLMDDHRHTRTPETSRSSWFPRRSLRTSQAYDD